MADSVEKIIKSKKYPQILLLFGEEEFLLEEAFKNIVKQSSIDISSEYDTEILDAENISYEQIVEKCNTYPFVSEKRVVAVKQFQLLFSTKQTKKKTNDSKMFSNYISSPSDSTFLVLSASLPQFDGITAAQKAKANQKYEKMISDAAFPYNEILTNHSWIEYPKVKEQYFGAWVKSRVNSFGKEIREDASEFLVAQTNQSLRDLSNEVDKLIAFIDERERVTLDDIAAVTGSSRKYNVFEFQKQVAKRNLKKAAMILEKMQKNEQQEILIVSILTKFFITLFKLIEKTNAGNNYQIAEQVGISSYFLKEYLDSLKLYSASDIEHAFFYLIEADEMLKSSSTDRMYILQKMLVKIMGN
ncbi:MAG TPA: DNA polymerase III subunit delta [Candidatus Kapabacteria bacterium]|nr:DNA polymerase III subunit delta [Candidatus Kapabacteria bacterium]HPO63936.1 DNA polymerase III subunit delta [Candidatus Kapabacteria bacterium]